MPVTIHAKPQESYNKLPPKVSPDPKLFPTAIATVCGKTIWQSVLLPDRLKVRSLLTEKVFGGKTDKAILDQAKIAELADTLSGAQQWHSNKKPYAPKDSFPRKFALPLGERSSTVFIELKPRKVKELPAPVWYLHIDLNPRKLRPDGMQAVYDALVQGSPSPFDVEALLQNAKVVHLDVALDLIGVRPGDLVVTAAKKSGKRVDYHGPDGRLQTTYLHAPRQTPKTAIKKRPGNSLGALLVRVYDRNAERADVGKPPPYPGHDTTRLEVSLKRFNKPLFLSGLQSISDPFSRVRAGFAADYFPDQAQAWMSYLACRASLGHEGAVERLGTDPKLAKQFAQVCKKNPLDLIPHASFGGLWAEGLKKTGTTVIIPTEPKN